MSRAQKSAKKWKWIFGISGSRGFRKVIICHAFGVIFFDYFRCSKKFFGAQVHKNLLMVLSIEPFSQNPPPQFGGALLTPPPRPGSENPGPHGPLRCPTRPLIRPGKATGTWDKLRNVPFRLGRQSGGRWPWLLKAGGSAPESSIRIHQRNILAPLISNEMEIWTWVCRDTERNPVTRDGPARTGRREQTTRSKAGSTEQQGRVGCGLAASFLRPASACWLLEASVCCCCPPAAAFWFALRCFVIRCPLSARFFAGGCPQGSTQGHGRCAVLCWYVCGDPCVPAGVLTPAAGAEAGATPASERSTDCSGCSDSPKCPACRTCGWAHETQRRPCRAQRAANVRGEPTLQGRPTAGARATPAGIPARPLGTAKLCGVSHGGPGPPSASTTPHPKNRPFQA